MLFFGGVGGGGRKYNGAENFMLSKISANLGTFGLESLVGRGELVMQVLFPAVFTVRSGGGGKINKFE